MKIEVHCLHDEMVEVANIVENPHPDRQLDILAAIIRSQGFRSPIVVSKKSGFIVTGHGRYQAALRLGLDSVPVNYQDFATEAEEWAHLIADNKLSELSENDPESLRDLLTNIQSSDLDSILSGFEDSEIESILSPKDESKESFDEISDDIETEHKCPKCGYEWS